MLSRIAVISPEADAIASSNCNKLNNYLLNNFARQVAGFFQQAGTWVMPM